jgi:hypothetical protein
LASFCDDDVNEAAHRVDLIEDPAGIPNGSPEELLDVRVDDRRDLRSAPPHRPIRTVLVRRLSA